jgi:hypothetical protein
VERVIWSFCASTRYRRPPKFAERGLETCYVSGSERSGSYTTLARVVTFPVRREKDRMVFVVPQEPGGDLPFIVDCIWVERKLAGVIKGEFLNFLAVMAVICGILLLTPVQSSHLICPGIVDEEPK